MTVLTASREHEFEPQSAILLHVLEILDPHISNLSCIPVTPTILPLWGQASKVGKTRKFPGQ